MTSNETDNNTEPEAVVETPDEEKTIKELIDEIQSDIKEEVNVQMKIMIKSLHDSVLIISIAEGVKNKYNEMLEGQGKGTVKNNAENRGYMKALKDIYHSLEMQIEIEEGVLKELEEAVKNDDTEVTHEEG